MKRTLSKESGAQWIDWAVHRTIRKYVYFKDGVPLQLPGFTWPVTVNICPSDTVVETLWWDHLDKWHGRIMTIKEYAAKVGARGAFDIDPLHDKKLTCLRCS